MSGHDYGRSGMTVDDLTWHQWIGDDGSDNGRSVSGVVSDWDAVMDADTSSVEWSVSDDDSDDLEVSLTLDQFVALRDKARAYDDLLRSVTLCPCPCTCT